LEERLEWKNCIIEGDLDTSIFCAERLPVQKNLINNPYRMKGVGEAGTSIAAGTLPFRLTSQNLTPYADEYSPKADTEESGSFSLSLHFL